jgi:hypothetical protein
MDDSRDGPGMTGPASESGSTSGRSGSSASGSSRSSGSSTSEPRRSRSVFGVQFTGGSKPKMLPARESCDQWLEDHWKYIRQKIMEDASRMADSEHLDYVEPAHVAEAAKKFSSAKALSSDKPSRFEGFWSAAGLTLISALLAIIFGALAYFASLQPNNGSAIASYGDIAKIFAGALVGSTGASAVVAARAKSN